jgi:hypothetical protein
MCERSHVCTKNALFFMSSCQTDCPSQDNIFNNITGIQVSQIHPLGSPRQANLLGINIGVWEDWSKGEGHQEKWAPFNNSCNYPVVNVTMSVMYMTLSETNEAVTRTALVNTSLQQWNHNSDCTQWWTDGPLNPPIKYMPSANLPGNLGPVVFKTCNPGCFWAKAAAFGTNNEHFVDLSPDHKVYDDHDGPKVAWEFNANGGSTNGHHYHGMFQFANSLTNPPVSSYGNASDVPNITKWRLLSPRAQREWSSDTSGMQQVSSASVIQGTSGSCEANILELRIWGCLPSNSLSASNNNVTESFYVLVRLETSEGLLLGTFTDIDNVPLCANATGANGSISNTSISNAMLMTTPSLASILLYPNGQLSPTFKAYSVAFQGLTYTKETNSLGSETATSPGVEGMTIFRTSLTLPSTNTKRGCPTIVSDQLAYLDFTTDYPFSSAVNFYALPPVVASNTRM